MRLGQKDQAKAISVTMMAYHFYGMPTDEQAHILSQIAGSCRFLWNRMLADVQARHEAGKEFSISTPRPAIKKSLVSNGSKEWIL